MEWEYMVKRQREGRFLKLTREKGVTGTAMQKMPGRFAP